MAQQIQLRGGTAAEWALANPILAEREMGVVTDTQNYKIGDGVTAWNSLPAYQLSPELGVVTLNAVADPSTPAAGQMALYSKSIGGRLMPKWKGPSGLDNVVQAALFNNNIYLLSPGNGTAPTVVGGVLPTATGTRSHPLITGGASLRVSVRRWNVVSAATANSMAYERGTFGMVIRGDLPGQGGFFYSLRFALPTNLAGKAVVMGLTSSTSITTTQVPSALLSCIMIAADSGDTNLQLMHNDAAGTCTKTDLGSDFAKNDVDNLYEVIFFCPPNSASIHWRITRLDSGAVVEGEVVADLPPNSVQLSPQMWVANSGVATAVQMDLLRLYIESDY